MTWSTALALAFGTMKATDLIKEVFNRTTGLTPQPYLKSVVAMTLGGAAACAYEYDWHDRLLLASGIAGAAAVLHEAHAVLATGADRNKVVVVDRMARAAASAASGSAPGRRITPL